MSIRFGIHAELPRPLNFVKTSCVYPVNQHEFLATTGKGFYRFERGEIKEYYNFKCTASVLVPELETVIGLTAKYNNFIGFQLFTKDKGSLLLKGCDAHQVSIFHMIYSPKSHVIFTVGDGIKTWNLTSTSWSLRSTQPPPTLGISFRAQFGMKYQTSILNPPVFDYERECILIPTESGILPYDIDGNHYDPVSRFPYLSLDPAAASLETQVKTSVYAKWTKKETGKTTYISADSQNGLCIWSNHRLKKRINNAGNVILMVNFLDSENVVYMDSRAILHLLNLKTERSFPSYSLPKLPNHVFVYNVASGPKIFCVLDMSLLDLDVNIPWRAWAVNVKAARSIKRCPKFNDAARICVITGNSFVKIYSPANGAQITAATPTSTSQPIASLYDRGVVIDELDEGNYELTDEEGVRDQLFSTLENGSVVGFDTSVQPAEEVFTAELRAKYICRVKYQDIWQYAVASCDSDFFIYDYNTLKIIKRYSVRQEPILGFHYHFKTGHVVILYTDEVHLYDLQRNRSVSILEIKGSEVNALHGDTLYIGYKNGSLIRLNIVGKKIVNPDPKGHQKPHEDAITGFGFGKTFMMTCSLDKTIQVWDYNMDSILKIELPTYIYSVAVLNGKRDILIATEDEIMKMDGDLLFDEPDIENKMFDTYDKIFDKMNPFSTMTLDETEDEDDEEEESRLLKAKRKEEEKKVKRVKIRRGRLFSIKSPIRPDININSNGNNPKENEEELDEEEKKRVLAEMNAITNEEGTEAPPPPPPAEKSEDAEGKGEEKSGEGEEDDGEDDEEEGVASNTVAKKKPRKKKNTISDLLQQYTAEEQAPKKPRRKKKLRVRPVRIIEEEDNTDDIDDLYNYFNQDEKLEEIKPRVVKKKVQYDYTLPNIIKEELMSSSPEIDDYDDDDDEERVKTGKSRKQRKAHPTKQKLPKRDKPTIETHNSIKKSRKKITVPSTKQVKKKRIKKVSNGKEVTEVVEEIEEEYEDEDQNESELVAGNELGEENKEIDIEKIVQDGMNIVASSSRSNKHKRRDSRASHSSQQREGSSGYSSQHREGSSGYSSQQGEGSSDYSSQQRDGISGYSSQRSILDPKQPLPPIPMADDQQLNPRNSKLIPKTQNRFAKGNKPMTAQGFRNDIKPLTVPGARNGNKTLNQIDPQMGHLLGIKDHFPAYLKNRAPTPPPIRWGNQLISQRLFRPVSKFKSPPKKVFTIPPPNVVIDPSAVLSEYGKGWEDLKPLVDKLLKEKNSLFSMPFSFPQKSSPPPKRKSRRNRSESKEDTFRYLYLSEDEKSPRESPLLQVNPFETHLLNDPILQRMSQSVDYINEPSPKTDFHTPRHSRKRRRSPQRKSKTRNESRDKYVPFWVKVIDSKCIEKELSYESQQIQELLEVRKAQIERTETSSSEKFIIKPIDIYSFIKEYADSNLLKTMEKNTKQKEIKDEIDFIYSSPITAKNWCRNSSYDQFRSIKTARRKAKAYPITRPIWTAFFSERKKPIKRPRIPLEMSIKITNIPLVKPNIH